MEYSVEYCVTFALVVIDVVHFKQIRRFDNELKYDFNDIDYCLHVKQENELMVVYNPEAIAFHDESATRKIDDKIGVSSELRYFKSKHKGVL
jgi:GT2 family glycosyltransferase